MGYCIEQEDAKFYIKADKAKDVVKAIKSLVGRESWGDHFSWVYNDFGKYNDLKKIIKCWRWNIEQDEQGNVIDISFDGEKLGDDLLFFKTIAPFVKKGSYIQMRGEDGAMWRWVFDGKSVKEVSPKVDWE